MPFWEARWLNGVAPKDLAPNLYKQARFKYRAVFTEVTSYKWISNLRELGTQSLLDEFALLYTTLNSIVLNNEKDKAHWRWTSNGEYSAASTLHNSWGQLV